MMLGSAHSSTSQSNRDSQSEFDRVLKELMQTFSREEKKQYNVQDVRKKLLSLCGNNSSLATLLIETFDCFEDSVVRKELFKRLYQYPQKSYENFSFPVAEEALARLFLLGDKQRNVLNLKSSFPDMIVLLLDPIVEQVPAPDTRIDKKVQQLCAGYTSFLGKAPAGDRLQEVRQVCSELLSTASSNPQLFRLLANSVKYQGDNFEHGVASMHRLLQVHGSSQYLGDVLQAVGPLFCSGVPLKHPHEQERVNKPDPTDLLVAVSSFLDHVSSPSFAKIFLHDPAILQHLVQSYDRLPSEEKLKQGLTHLHRLLIDTHGDQDSLDTHHVFGPSPETFFKNLGWHSFLGLKMIAHGEISNYEPQTFSKGLKNFFASKYWGHKTNPSNQDLYRVGQAYLMLSDHWRRTWSRTRLQDIDSRQLASFEIGILGCAALNSFPQQPKDCSFRGLAAEMKKLDIQAADLMRVLSLVPQRSDGATARLEEILLTEHFIDNHQTDEYRRLSSIRAFQIHAFIQPMIDGQSADKVFQNSFLATTNALSERLYHLHDKQLRTIRPLLVSCVKRFGTHGVDWLKDCLSHDQVTDRDVPKFLQFCLSVITSLPAETTLSANTSAAQVSLLYQIWNLHRHDSENPYQSFARQILVSWPSLKAGVIQQAIIQSGDMFTAQWGDKLDKLLDASLRMPRHITEEQWVTSLQQMLHAGDQDSVAVTDIKLGFESFRLHDSLLTGRTSEASLDAFVTLLGGMPSSETKNLLSLLPEILPSLVARASTDDTTMHSYPLHERIRDMYQAAVVCGTGTLYALHSNTSRLYPLRDMPQLEPFDQFSGYQVRYSGSFPKQIEQQFKQLTELFTGRGRFARYDPLDSSFSISQFHHDLFDGIVQVLAKDIRVQLDSRDDEIVDTTIEQLKEIANHSAFLAVQDAPSFLDEEVLRLRSSLKTVLDVVARRQGDEGMYDLLDDPEILYVRKLFDRITAAELDRKKQLSTFELFQSHFHRTTGYTSTDTKQLKEAFHEFVHPRKATVQGNAPFLKQMSQQYRTNDSSPMRRQAPDAVIDDPWTLLQDLSMRHFTDETREQTVSSVMNQFAPLFYTTLESAEQFLESLQQEVAGSPSPFIVQETFERRKLFIKSLSRIVQADIRASQPLKDAHHKTDQGPGRARKDKFDSFSDGVVHLLSKKLQDDLSSYLAQDSEEGNPIGKTACYLRLLIEQRMLDVSDEESPDVSPFLSSDREPSERISLLFNEALPFYMRTKIAERTRRDMYTALSGATVSYPKMGVAMLHMAEAVEDFYLDFVGEDADSNIAQLLDDRAKKLRELCREIRAAWSIEDSPGVALFTGDIPSLLVHDDHAREGKVYKGIFCIERGQPVLLAYSRSIEHPFESLIYSPVGKLLLERQ